VAKQALQPGRDCELDRRATVGGLDVFPWPAPDLVALDEIDGNARSPTVFGLGLGRSPVRGDRGVGVGDVALGEAGNDLQRHLQVDRRHRSFGEGVAPGRGRPLTRRLPGGGARPLRRRHDRHGVATGAEVVGVLEDDAVPAADGERGHQKVNPHAASSPKPIARGSWRPAVVAHVGGDHLVPALLSAQDALDDLPEHAVAAGRSRDEPRGRLARAGGRGEGDGHSRSLQRGNVEEVVADIGRRGARQIELRAQRLQRLALATGAEHDDVDAELVTARLRDRAGLPGDHGRPKLCPPGERDGDSVARVEALQLIAVVGEDHAAVGEDAIHVGDHETYGTGSRRPDRRSLHTEYPSARTGRGSGASASFGSVGRMATIPAKNQNGSMIRMMMNEFDPIEWTRRPTVAAAKPIATPRSSGSSSRRVDVSPTRSTAHNSPRNTTNPTTPVSTRVRAYWASMNRNPVTPNPNSGRLVHAANASCIDRRRSEVDGSKAIWPNRTVA